MPWSFPTWTLMRERKIVNVGDLLRFELEGLSHRLPAHQRVVGYEISFEPLPRGTTQQIERHEVERRVRERQATPICATPDRAWLNEPHAAAAVPLIQARAKGGRVWPDANLELDLGLDSLERVELLTELEQRLATKLPQHAAAEILTVRQLVDALRRIDKPIGAIDKPEVCRHSDQSAHSPSPADLWTAILTDLPAASDPRFGWLLRRRTLATPILFVLLRVVHMLFFRARVDGLDRLPASGPYIITPNHQSYVDPFVLCGVLPFRAFKELFVVGAPEYFETPFTRWVARTSKLVPVDPDSHLVPAMQASAFGLSHKKILMMFPEGERSIDGTVKKFKKGAPILARHLHVPMVPVALKGIHESGRVTAASTGAWWRRGAATASGSSSASR